MFDLTSLKILDRIKTDKEGEEKTLLSEGRSVLKKEFDRADIVRDVRLAVPVQTVDATPSNQLIRQYFPRRTDLFGCTRSKPSQGSVPADLT
jgi:hypothetical protein